MSGSYRHGFVTPDLRLSGMTISGTPPRNANVRADPVGQALRPSCLGVRVVRCAQHRDEDLGVEEDLAGAAVHDRHRLPGVVDEQLLPGTVILPHHQVDLAVPGPVQVAEPTVLIPLWVGTPVF